MAALLKRAYDINAISERKYQFLWTQMAKEGSRKREPIELDIPKEHPLLLSDIINLHIDELEYSPDQICDLMGLFRHEFDEIYPINKNNKLKGNQFHLRVVQ